MSNLIPFDSAQVPAHIATAFNVGEDDLTAGAGASFPVISIKGKVFHIVRGDERTLVRKPGGDEDEPAGSIQVVILKSNPHLSKIYYEKDYEEGSNEKPTCYSNDGIAPAADAAEPQAKKCLTCPHNQWGSRITDNGKKGKACADARRIAVAPAGQINDPMLLRVPAASLAPLREYGEVLKKRGVKYPAVVTKIGFDFSVAHPALTFKPVGFLPDELIVKVREMIDSDIVAQIIGVQPTAAQLPAPTAETASERKPEPESKPEVKPVEKKAEKPVEKKAEPVKGKQTKPVSTTIEVADDKLESDLASALAGAGFDD